MNRISFTSISVILAIVMIPQALFWWLAPAGADARLAVFILGSILTVCIPVTCFVTYWNCDIRRAGGVFAAGIALDLISILIGAMLMMFNATGRTALFAYLIMILAVIGVMVPLIASAVSTPWQGVGGDINEDMYEEENEETDRSGESYSTDVTRGYFVDQKKKTLPPRKSDPRQICRPLPARNR